MQEPSFYARRAEGKPLVASDGTPQGYVRAGRMLIRKIRNNPSGYYVNVHNGDLPNGA